MAKIIRYLRINRLVLEKRYEELINELQPFIETYTVYICSGFKVYNNLHKRLDSLLRSNPNSFTAIKESYSNFSREEVISDIIFAILIMANRYVFNNRFFISYLCTCFPYEYSRVIFKQTKDITTHNGIIDYYDNINANLADDSALIDNYIDEIDGYLKDNELTYKWINDILDEEHYPFNILSPKEKLILIYKFRYRFSDKMASLLFKCHLNTFNQEKLKCLRKLDEQMNLEHKRDRCPD